MNLHDPTLVRHEYESARRLEVRNEAFRELLDGPSAEQEALDALREPSPRRILEVGCGTGAFAQRMGSVLGADVLAVDLSEHMVALARDRGVSAQLGDVQRLGFADGSFDCAFAGWMLYHVPDLDLAVAELARVLRPGGRLVATTHGEDMPELWSLLGGDPEQPLSFSVQTGSEILGAHFDRVACRIVTAWTVFPSVEAVRRYVGATLSRRHLASRVPEIEAPFRTRHVQAVFVADKRLD